MTYRELKERQQQEVNDFPFIWAFNEKQLAEGMQRLGLDPATDKDKLQSIGAGGIIRKTDAEAMREMFDRHRSEAATRKGGRLFYWPFLLKRIFLILIRATGRGQKNA